MNFLKLICLCLFFFSIPQWMKSDFKPPPIHAEIPAHPKWDTPLPDKEILQILSQSFSYFSHGNQSTVFQSEDGQYVLKLFRYRRSLFPLVHKIKNWFKTRPKQDFFSKMDKTFDAAHLASTEASQFTKVVYCHLNLTHNLLPTLNLKGYSIDLDRYRFVLQKKVTPFKEALLQAKAHPEQMNRLIDSFCRLLLERSALHIRNSDPNLGPNFGFLNEEAVELDFGNYRKMAPDPVARKKEMAGYLVRLDHWLKENAPEYRKELQLKRAILYDRLNEASQSVY